MKLSSGVRKEENYTFWDKYFSTLIEYWSEIHKILLRRIDFGSHSILLQDAVQSTNSILSDLDLSSNYEWNFMPDSVSVLWESIQDFFPEWSHTMYYAIFLTSLSSVYIKHLRKTELWFNEWSMRIKFMEYLYEYSDTTENLLFNTIDELHTWSRSKSYVSSTKKSLRDMISYAFQYKNMWHTDAVWITSRYASEEAIASVVSWLESTLWIDNIAHISDYWIWKRKWVNGYSIEWISPFVNFCFRWKNRNEVIWEISSRLWYEQQIYRLYRKFGYTNTLWIMNVHKDVLLQEMIISLQFVNHSLYRAIQDFDIRIRILGNIESIEQEIINFYEKRKEEIVWEIYAILISIDQTRLLVNNLKISIDDLVPVVKKIFFLKVIRVLLEKKISIDRSILKL